MEYLYTFKGFKKTNETQQFAVLKHAADFHKAEKERRSEERRDDEIKTNDPVNKKSTEDDPEMHEEGGEPEMHDDENF